MPGLEAPSSVAPTLGEPTRDSQPRTLVARPHTWARRPTGIQADTECYCQRKGAYLMSEG